jgi:hypothetical protein
MKMPSEFGQRGQNSIKFPKPNQANTKWAQKQNKQKTKLAKKFETNTKFLYYITIAYLRSEIQHAAMWWALTSGLLPPQYF